MHLTRLARFALVSLAGFAAGLVFAADQAPDKRPSITEGVVWKFQTGKSFDAYPTVDGSVVYCGNMEGLFYAIDSASGKELWHYTAPQAITTKAVVGGRLVYFESGDTLFALDRQTGVEAWRYSAGEKPAALSIGFTDYHHSSPVIDSDVVYFGDSWGHMNGVDTATGKLVWQYTTETRKVIRSAPAIAEGMIFFGDWEGDVYAVKLATKELAWKHRMDNTREYYGAVVSAMVVNKGVLYFGSQHDVYSPLDIKTGKPVWTFVDAKKTYLPSTPVFVGDKVIVASTILRFAIFCFDEKGDIYWQVPTDGINFVTPVVKDKVLVINNSNFGGSGCLLLIDTDNGSRIKRLQIERASPSSPVFAGDRLIIGCGDGALYALDYPTLMRK